VANTFGCKVGMPFTYLGLPLGTTRLTINEFSLVLSRIEGRLSGISKMLSYHGRVILLNYVFSSLLTKMTDIEINSWSGGDINRKGGGTCLAA